MTDPNRPNEDAAAQSGEPVVSKPYIMPDDPEEGSVEALTKEAAEARDKMLRTLAEMENLRKRTSREVADARTYGITGFARDILDIADNLQRALDAVPAEMKATADPALKAFIEGVELTERSLLNTLEKNGVKKFDPSGEKFDPNFQQAMYEVPDPSVPAGTVVQARNQLDAMTHSVKKSLGEYGDKVGADDKEKIEAALKDARKSMKK